MKTQLDEDNYLTIQLLSFDRPTELTEKYYFLEMSTLQATTLLLPGEKIISSKIIAYTNDNKYLDEKTVAAFATINDFNEFFINNPDYYIHSCDLELENGVSVGSHDDGEVSIEFSNENAAKIIIDKIFDKYNLHKNLVEILKNKPGHYIAIDEKSNVTADFGNFDEYLKKR